VFIIESPGKENRWLMAVIQQEFDHYYQSIYGARWENIKAALENSEKQVRFINQFAEPVKPFNAIDWLFQCEWHEGVESIPRGANELLQYYVLDPASVLVARNLKVEPGEHVLDLCAAPGGKSLVLAQSLFSKHHVRSELMLNELSADRRERLKKVIQQYLPREIRSQIWLRGKDGMRFGLGHQSQFDAILVDAPCSGERHLLENVRELEQWKEWRSKSLAQKQYTLLCSAWIALKPGGRLMYSTCSLSVLENDGVIRRFFKKRGDVALGQLEFLGPGAEATECGVIYLPDQSSFGPMYSCLLIKAPSS
jgi:16S rRNA C967 or C1407 C5-methylase (RsmB/RsmF family)